MSIGLLPACIERVSSVDDFISGVNHIRNGNLHVVMMSGHEPWESPLDLATNLNNFNWAMRKKTIDTITNGAYSAIIQGTEVNPGFLSKLGVVLLDKTDDVGPHIDPTFKRKVETNNQAPFTLHYSPFGACTLRAAALQGSPEELRSFSYVRLMRQLRNQFDETATEASIQQGDIVAFMANSQPLSDGQVIPSVMHDFISTSDQFTRARAIYLVQ